MKSISTKKRSWSMAFDKEQSYSAMMYPFAHLSKKLCSSSLLEDVTKHEIQGELSKFYEDTIGPFSLETHDPLQMQEAYLQSQMKNKQMVLEKILGALKPGLRRGNNRFLAKQSKGVSLKGVYWKETKKKWVAEWDSKAKNGMRIWKTFSATRYGYKDAWKLAVKARIKAELLGDSPTSPVPLVSSSVQADKMSAELLYLIGIVDENDEVAIEEQELLQCQQSSHDKKETETEEWDEKLLRKNKCKWQQSNYNDSMDSFENSSLSGEGELSSSSVSTQNTHKGFSHEDGVNTEEVDEEEKKREELSTHTSDETLILKGESQKMTMKTPLSSANPPSGILLRKNDKAELKDSSTLVHEGETPGEHINHPLSFKASSISTPKARILLSRRYFRRRKADSTDNSANNCSLGYIQQKESYRSKTDGDTEKNLNSPLGQILIEKERNYSSEAAKIRQSINPTLSGQEPTVKKGLTNSQKKADLEECQFDQIQDKLLDVRVRYADFNEKANQFYKSTEAEKQDSREYLTCLQRISGKTIQEETQQSGNADYPENECKAKKPSARFLAKEARLDQHKTIKRKVKKKKFFDELEQPIISYSSFKKNKKEEIEGLMQLQGYQEEFFGYENQLGQIDESLDQFNVVERSESNGEEEITSLPKNPFSTNKDSSDNHIPLGEIKEQKISKQLNKADAIKALPNKFLDQDNYTKKVDETEEFCKLNNLKCKGRHEKRTHLALLEACSNNRTTEEGLDEYPSTTLEAKKINPECIQEGEGISTFIPKWFHNEQGASKLEETNDTTIEGVHSYKKNIGCISPLFILDDGVTERNVRKEHALQNQPQGTEPGNESQVYESASSSNKLKGDTLRMKILHNHAYCTRHKGKNRGRRSAVAQPAVNVCTEASHAILKKEELRRSIYPRGSKGGNFVNSMVCGKPPLSAELVTETARKIASLENSTQSHKCFRKKKIARRNNSSQSRKKRRQLAIHQPRGSVKEFSASSISLSTKLRATTMTSQGTVSNFAPGYAPRHMEIALQDIKDSGIESVKAERINMMISPRHRFCSNSDEIAREGLIKEAKISQSCINQELTLFQHSMHGNSSMLCGGPEKIQQSGCINCKNKLNFSNSTSKESRLYSESALGCSRGDFPVFSRSCSGNWSPRSKGSDFLYKERASESISESGIDFDTANPEGKEHKNKEEKIPDNLHSEPSTTILQRCHTALYPTSVFHQKGLTEKQASIHNIRANSEKKFQTLKKQSPTNYAQNDYYTSLRSTTARGTISGDGSPSINSQSDASSYQGRRQNEEKPKNEFSVKNSKVQILFEAAKLLMNSGISVSHPEFLKRLLQKIEDIHLLSMPITLNDVEDVRNMVEESLANAAQKNQKASMNLMQSHYGKEANAALSPRESTASGSTPKSNFSEGIADDTTETQDVGTALSDDSPNTIKRSIRESDTLCREEITKGHDETSPNSSSIYSDHRLIQLLKVPICWPYSSSLEASREYDNKTGGIRPHGESQHVGLNGLSASGC